MSGLAVGLTPLETRRDVVLHLADRAEALGYDAFFLAEGWAHDASVLLTEVALRPHTFSTAVPSRIRVVRSATSVSSTDASWPQPSARKNAS